MPVCHNCGNHEMIGALFCKECGASLPVVDEPITNTFASPFQHPADSATRMREVQMSPEALAALYIHDFSACLNMFDRKTYMIGRESEGAGASLDIDLTEYEGYRNGVSRIHASLIIGKDGVSLLDLDSANGTLLNNRRLMPRVPYPVSDGDQVIFGKLKVQVLLKPAR